MTLAGRMCAPACSMIAGIFHLTHTSPDRLGSKRLLIEADGSFELLEFEGGISGAYQFYYSGSWIRDGMSVRFRVKSCREVSNYLTDDAIPEEDRTIIRPHDEEFRGRIEGSEPLLLRVSRRGYEFEYRNA